MESQPKNPEFRNNPENFHPCKKNDLVYLREKKKIIQVRSFLVSKLLCVLVHIKYTYKKNQTCSFQFSFHSSFGIL